MKFLSQFILVTFLSMFFACNSNKNNNTAKDETAISLDETSTEVTRKTYVYPNDLFAENNVLNFYCIGFNTTGQIAYVDRPCDGGCGCCTHNIIIQDLTTDKIVSTLNLMGPEINSIEDHKADWIRNKDRVATFLNSFGIVQNPLNVNHSNLINYDNNTFKVTPSYYLENDPSAMSGSKMNYSASVLLNNVKSKTVTSGKENDGESFEYLGYLKSPYSNQLALLFNKKYRGFEAEPVNDVVVVGCIMDPKFF
ncbi:MAG: hypothetical protein NT127_06240 [Sphingobacteriales bacterium]|nr:hypothetical protein [Sphingobacteriales bacterium]